MTRCRSPTPSSSHPLGSARFGPAARVDTPSPRLYARRDLPSEPEMRVSWMRFMGLLSVLLAAGLASAQDARPAGRPSGSSAAALPILEKASEVKDEVKLERSAKALGTM